MAAFVFAPLTAVTGAVVSNGLVVARSRGGTRSSASAKTRSLPRMAQQQDSVGVAAPPLPEWGLQLLDESDSLVIMDTALERLGTETAISFSGAEDVVLIELAKRSGRPFRVFSLDTGRLHPETYRFMAEVEQHFGLRIEFTFPNAGAVQELVDSKGLFSFYEDGHSECCSIRKVNPLRRKLSTLSGWITGQRSDQSPSTRKNVSQIEVDSTFTAADGGPLLKFNPLAKVSSAEVWDIIRQSELPYNLLHNKGFKSIGCEPCTKPILPSQHEREGRWWWEDSTHKECGLHAGNLEP